GGEGEASETGAMSRRFLEPGFSCWSWLLPVCSDCSCESVRGLLSPSAAKALEGRPTVSSSPESLRGSGGEGEVSARLVQYGRQSQRWKARRTGGERGSRPRPS